MPSLKNQRSLDSPMQSNHDSDKTSHLGTQAKAVQGPKATSIATEPTLIFPETRSQFQSRLRDEKIMDASIAIEHLNLVRLSARHNGDPVLEDAVTKSAIPCFEDFIKTLTDLDTDTFDLRYCSLPVFKDQVETFESRDSDDDERTVSNRVRSLHIWPASISKDGYGRPDSLRLLQSRSSALSNIATTGSSGTRSDDDSNLNERPGDDKKISPHVG